MSFASGDSVSARIPGSRYYSDGKIKSVKGDTCIVYFPRTEKELSISSKDILSRKSPSRNRSPARTQSPVRKTRSPARTKSPSRREVTTETKTNEKSKSPSRTTRPKSPSRKEKSPSRKEPKATTKEEKSPRKEKYPARKSPSRNVRKDKDADTRKNSNEEQLSSTEPDSESEKDPFLNRFRNRSRKRSDDEKQTARVSPLNTVNGVVEKVSTSIGVMTRRALRTTASQPKEIEKILHYQDTIEQIYRNEFSDNENEPVFEAFKTKKASTPIPVKKESPVARSSIARTIKIEKEFGGTLGTIFFAIVAIAVPVWLQLWCNKDHCEYTKIPDLKLIMKNWRKLFDLEVALIYVAFQLLYAILSILPIGGRIAEGPLSKYGKIRLRANGLFSFIVVTAIIFGLEYKNIRALNLLYEKQLQFLIFAIIFGIVQAILLYIRSGFIPLGSLNVQANTDSRFYNFFMGCELNPRIFGLFDVKQLLIRTSAHIAVLLYLAYLMRSAGVISPFDLRLETIVVKPTLITICLIQIYFFIDVLFFEHVWLSTFEIQSEGVGFMSTVGYGIWPFTVTLLGKYIFEHNIERPLWVLVLIFILNAIGLTIYRGSNTQKHEFRKNPFNPALAHLETIPTMQGKKLLVSGYWGVVRHPNYAGDLLMELAWSSVAPTSPATLVAFPFALSFFIHRSSRDNARCKQKYGSAWDRYCERVKYVLIPKVY